MKKFLFFIFLSASGCATPALAQQVKIVYPGYTSFFNLKNQIPDSVKWTITKEHLTGVKIPRNNQFHPEKGMKNLKRDYINSHQDQGHNSPYDDNYWSADAEYQCFSYINMFPQRHLLNAQTWLRLEDYSRQMALKYGSCQVKTSWMGIDYKMGIDSVVVPLYCVKTIKYADTIKTFIMPNRDTVIRHSFTYYKAK